eukprot:1037683-Pelagomonas_calceolata.AAC.10
MSAYECHALLWHHVWSERVACRALKSHALAVFHAKTPTLCSHEAGHKLMKIGIQPGQEIEMVTMVIECCSQKIGFSNVIAQVCPLKKGTPWGVMELGQRTATMLCALIP